MKYLADVVTLQYDIEECTGCGRCLEVCPRNVFTIEDKKARIADRDACIECGACEKNCEFDALHVAAGVGCAAALFKGILTGKEPSCDCSGGKEISCC
jgi:NAD-dependent dihydropyrimidine dehydrogenase PreA subunit